MVAIGLSQGVVSSRCVFPIVRASPVIAFSAARRRSISTPASDRPWSGAAFLCRRRSIHSSTILLVSTSSSSSSSLVSKSTASKNPDATNTTIATQNNSNNDEKVDNTSDSTFNDASIPTSKESTRSSSSSSSSTSQQQQSIKKSISSFSQGIGRCIFYRWFSIQFPSLLGSRSVESMGSNSRTLACLSQLFTSLGD